MSQGDRISQGGKGTNYPYQSKVLKGLQQSIDELIDIQSELSSVIVTPSLIRATGVGAIAAGAYSFSVANTGLLDGILLGVVIRPGEVISFDAGALNNTYGVVSYDGTGTELLITVNS